jgi:type IV pilus assembly protein PilX
MEQVVNTKPVSAEQMPSLQSNQRGVVLFIALIVMVAMSLAAIALMRSVDTTTTVIGNLAFRQASVLPANFGIEDAAAGLFTDASPTNIPRIADRRVDTPTENYYAAHSQAAGWDDKYGVPQPLQTKAAALALTRQLPKDGSQNIITYVTERMCNPNAAVIPADNSTARSWCDMAPEKTPPGGTVNDPGAGFDFRQVYYRVTVRVDGPPGTNTVSFLQAMLR